LRAFPRFPRDRPLVKAAVCRSFGAPLTVEELRLDAPQVGEVRAELAACAICHSDIAFAEGAWGGELPAVYGHEAAGIVHELGSGVTGLRPGDRVVVGLLRSCGRCFFCARGAEHLCEGAFPADARAVLRTTDGQPVAQAMHTGAFAAEVVVDESQVAALPDSLPLDVASVLGCGVLTGVGAALDRARVTPGASVVVIGTGGVGVNVVQGAALAGASSIVALDLSPWKREAAKSFGATDAVDPAADDPVAAVRELTDERGADVVFVTVGKGDVIESAVAYARRGGTLVVVGMPVADETFRLVGVDLVHDDVSVLGTKIGSGSGSFRSAVTRLVELYEEGRLRLDELVSGRYPLDRINDAIADAQGDTLRNVVLFDR
jgi:S-(hydroxymethyl)glutathione dehydrogenase / alcohol dehydrogenase